MTNLTLEEFENGIKIYQDEGLYKFTSDAIKLARFCKIKSTDNVLDMCAGSGVIGLYAYSIKPFGRIYFNDIQSVMCDLINKNIETNGLQDKTKTLCKDLNDLKVGDFGKCLDVIVCNPPYFKVDSKVNKNAIKSICRHEIATNLNQIISKAGELIKNKGKFYLVIPSSRLCECVVLLNKNKFEVKDIEIYHTNNNATICLMESVKDGNSGVKIKIIKENL